MVMVSSERSTIGLGYTGVLPGAYFSNYGSLHTIPDWITYPQGGSNMLDMPMQRTTSWRTGRGLPTVDTIEADTETPSTEAGVFQYLSQLDADESFNPSRPWDTGHPFSTSFQYFYGISVPSVNLYSQFLNVHYSGPLIPGSNSDHHSGYWPADTLPESRYGPAAIAATAPVNPASTFGQGFYETLLDGLPELGNLAEIWVDKAADFRALAGSKYLSLEFDWLPFIGDIQSTVGALSHASSIIAQYQRDSGRIVRRNFRFPVQHSVLEHKVSSGGFVRAPNVFFGYEWGSGDSTTSVCGTGTSTVDLTTSVSQVWFKGAFSYFLQAGSDPLSKMSSYVSKAQHLSGLEMTPELLWQLAPWSWLVDWKTQIGNSIKNASNFQQDGLVIRWGYLMQETASEHTITAYNIPTFGFGATTSNPVLYDPAITYVNIDRQRVQASPYGFGVDPGGFNPFQWSILGALGITRAPGILH